MKVNNFIDLGQLLSYKISLNALHKLQYNTFFFIKQYVNFNIPWNKDLSKQWIFSVRPVNQNCMLSKLIEVFHLIFNENNDTLNVINENTGL